MLQVLVGIGGVDHQHIAVFLVHINIGIIHGAAGGIGDHAVLGTAGLNGCHIAGQDPLHEGQAFRALDDQTSHVGHVEDTALAAGGQMFGDNTGRVLDRHFPAAEINHLSACGQVCIVELCTLEFTHNYNLLLALICYKPAFSRMTGTFFSAPMAMMCTPGQRFWALISAISSAAISMPSLLGRPLIPFSLPSSAAAVSRSI